MFQEIALRTLGFGIPAAVVVLFCLGYLEQRRADGREPSRRREMGLSIGPTKRLPKKRRDGMELTKVDQLVEKHNHHAGALKEVLRGVQEEFGWLPLEALDHIAQKLDIPPRTVYNLAIFHKDFRVIPRDHAQVDGTCVVDLSKHLINFLEHDLCGKCLPCREGLKRMHEITCDIAEGTATPEQIDLLGQLAWLIKEVSACTQGEKVGELCLTLVRDYRHQYEGHVNHEGCPSGACR